MESLKPTFSIFVLTPPPINNKGYQDHLKATSNNVADEILEQLEARQANYERKCFLGGDRILEKM